MTAFTASRGHSRPVTATKKSLTATAKAYLVALAVAVTAGREVRP